MRMCVCARAFVIPRMHTTNCGSTRAYIAHLHTHMHTQAHTHAHTYSAGVPRLPLFSFQNSLCPLCLSRRPQPHPPPLSVAAESLPQEALASLQKAVVICLCAYASHVYLLPVELAPPRLSACLPLPSAPACFDTYYMRCLCVCVPVSVRLFVSVWLCPSV